MRRPLKPQRQPHSYLNNSETIQISNCLNIRLDVQIDYSIHFHKRYFVKYNIRTPLRLLYYSLKYNTKLSDVKGKVILSTNCFEIIYFYNDHSSIRIKCTYSQLCSYLLNKNLFVSHFYFCSHSIKFTNIINITC